MLTSEWDETKNQQNCIKYNVDFFDAQKVFHDPHRLILKDLTHSTAREVRYYCIGKIGQKICTVRFTYRNKKIRIFGAGYWRKERKIYEAINKKG